MFRLSPLTRLRIKHFTTNTRGYYSLWILGVILTITMCADLIANDHPLIVYYKGEVSFPVLFFYPETRFGGQLEIEADYTDPYILDKIQKHGWYVMPLIPYHHDSISTNLIGNLPEFPSSRHLLGVDTFGRDILAYTIYGLRTSLCFGFMLTLLSSIIGIAIGAVQGFYGGKIDIITQRIIEIWSGLPVLYLLIILGSMIELTFLWLLAIMLLFKWTILVNIVRAECLRTRNLDYVKAAHVLGVPSYKIIFRHILPNAMITTFTLLPFIMSGSISSLMVLDFLGLGLHMSTPSLGELILQGKNNLFAPWLACMAFTLIATCFSLLLFIGEAIRDAFDPHKMEQM